MLFSDKGEWKGKPYEVRIYPLDDYKKLPQIDQIHAICFLNKNEVVFYENIEGWLGSPGGGVEKGEEVEDTIRRELIEEAQLRLIDWRVIGYEEITYPEKPEGENKGYFLRTVAKVELIDASIEDPCEKAIGRVVVATAQAAEKLNWGKKGEVLISLAKDKYSQTWKS